MVFPWFSYGFPMVFPWVSLWVSLWVSHGASPGGVRTPLGGLGGDGDAAPGAKLPRTRHWGHGAGREAPDGRRSGGCFNGIEWDWDYWDFSWGSN